ncbi:MAG: filamentous hemagglutinin N-terminal domain-containing protein, partial [Pseudomonadota bacterium]
MQNKASLLSTSALYGRRSMRAGLIGFFALGQAAAQDPGAGIIVDPDANVGFQPNVSLSETGTPIVDITDPTSGVSINRFGRFDVDETGVVLNNSTTGGNSVLAGQVGANPNLTSGSADIIVNEVASSGGSSINGALEVFGPRADVIVANPNGITCDGCTFINTNAVTLSTGTVAANGAGVVLEVTGGTVRVEGDGLTADGSVSLVGRKVELDGVVEAGDELLLSGGTQSFDANSGVSEGRTGSGSGNGEYAVDGTEFGVARAGQITVIGNEAGLGVRLLGAAQAGQGGIDAISVGDLFVKSVESVGEISLRADGAVEIDSGVLALGAVSIEGEDISAAAETGIFSGQEVVVSANEDAVLAGDIQSLGNVTVNADGDILSSGFITAAGAAAIRAGGNANIAEGRVTAQEISVEAGNEARIATGFLDSAGTIDVSARDIALGEGALFDGSGVNLEATEDFENAANLFGLGGLLNINFTTDLRNLATGIFAFDIVDLTLDGNVTNDGIIFGENGLSIEADNIINTEFGTISGSTVSLRTNSDLFNFGTLVSSNALSINSVGELINTGVVSGETLTVSASSVTNFSTGQIQSTLDGIELLLSGAVRNEGTIFSSSDLALITDAEFINAGLISAIGDASFAIEDFVGLETGGLQASSLDFEGTRDFTNNGFIGAVNGGEFTFSGQFENDATLQFGTALSIFGDRVTLGSDSIVQSGGDVFLSSAKDLFQGGALLGNEVIFDAGGAATLSGVSVSNTNLSAFANSIVIDAFAEIGGGDITFEATDIVSEGIVSGDVVTVEASRLENDGEVQAEQELRLFL